MHFSYFQFFSSFRLKMGVKFFFIEIDNFAEKKSEAVTQANEDVLFMGGRSLFGRS